MKIRKRLSEKNFKFIYSKVPRLCVDLVIVKNNKILLTKRSIFPHKGLWHFPGGGVLYREKIENAIKRIAKSELNVKVIPEKFLDYYEVLKDGFRHSVSLVFLCRIPAGQKIKLLEQASKYKFFDKIPKKIQLYHKEFLKNHFLLK